VDAFRRQAPSLPAALSTYGAAVAPFVFPFDYAAWVKGGFALLPQAYLSVTNNYCPACTVANAVRSGVPASVVHPMIGVGWSQGRPALSGADYIAPLLAAGTHGFSVFLGERATSNDFFALGAAIGRDRLASS
jgi:hypothetical protein